MSRESIVSFDVQPARSDDLADVRSLMRAYQLWLIEKLGVSLCFQDFDTELAALPGAYVLPRGQLWIARDVNNATALGIIAVKPLDAFGECELKRLWVADFAKGRGAGRALANVAVDFARSAGYTTMKLDTLRDRMPAAISLYRDLGFTETMGYVHNPEPDVLFMKLDLQ
ncbi:MAG: GNAT family N-acetyltransferase [Betaproteobacteria bacterium]|nr:MAG: GNAT family N-acetyltransferase [Betaproteobacteria bacterium]